jgi:hypothetical protein
MIKFLPEALLVILSVGLTWILAKKKNQREIETYEVAMIKEAATIWQALAKDLHKEVGQLKSLVSELKEENRRLRKDIHELKEANKNRHSNN